MFENACVNEAIATSKMPIEIFQMDLLISMQFISFGALWPVCGQKSRESGIAKLFLKN